MSGIRTAQCNGITLSYETFGDPDDVPILLVMGLGAQMLAWPDEFCAMLVERGHYVIRFDNRDMGLSTHFDDAAKGAAGVSIPWPPTALPADRHGRRHSRSHR